MKIYDYSFQPIDSRMYLCIEGNKALVIDPCVDQGAFLRLEEERVEQVLVILTHEHYDHISGVNAFKERYSCDVLCSKKCAENIEDPKKNISRYYDALFIGKNVEKYVRTEPYSCTATQVFERSYSFEWEGHQILLRETPGHSDGSICIFLDDSKVFTGDSLLKETDVTTKLKSGSRTLYQTVTKPILEKLPPDVYIYPGHGSGGCRREFEVK